MLRRLCAWSVVVGLLLPAAAAAQGKAAPKSGADADQQELFKYVLTMDKIQKIGVSMHALTELAKQHPEIKDDTSSGDSLDEMAKKFQKYPDAIAVLTKNGLTPREFAVGTLTLMQAGMAVGMKKGGMYKESPPEMLQVVSGPNLSFVEQHFDEILKVIPELSPGK
jgi:hypothetical protein